MLLRNVLLALSLLVAAPAFADTNISDSPACEISIKSFKQNYPKSTFKQFTPEQFKFISEKFAALGHPIPEDVTTIDLTVATDSPDVLILLAFDKDGCFVTHSKMTKEQFADMLGGMPKSSSNGEKKFDYDSSKPNDVNNNGA